MDGSTESWPDAQSRGLETAPPSAIVATRDAARALEELAADEADRTRKKEAAHEAALAVEKAAAIREFKERAAELFWEIANTLCSRKEAERVFSCVSSGERGRPAGPADRSKRRLLRALILLKREALPEPKHGTIPRALGKELSEQLNVRWGANAKAIEKAIRREMAQMDK